MAIVIVDIDGTVAHRTNRGPFDYQLVIHDESDKAVVETLRCLWSAGHKLVFVSAREDWCFNDTYKWLTENCPPFIKLYMRRSGDNRRDADVKKEIFETFLKNEDILCVFDDRDQVVEMWRELGLKCMQVGYGDF
jgi:uncharacterized HAD superfamily protein